MANDKPEEFCILCGTTVNIEYCRVCDKWFCQECAHKLLKRSKSALRALWEKLSGTAQSATR